MKEIFERLSEPTASLVSSFFGMIILCLIHYYTFQGTSDPQSIIYVPKDFPPALIASFAASAVLIYGAYLAPLSQPKNLILGHLTGAIIGVTIKQIFMYTNTDLLWLQASLAISLTIFVMEVINAVHPPGGTYKRSLLGATALVAITGGNDIIRLGYWFVLMPVLFGSILLLITAILCAKLFGRTYPTHWW